jgi:ligand-binding sensor domain-containing protein
LKDEQITYYTQKNNGLPRDLIYELVCDQYGAVWFSSCAHLLGGLGCYSNGKFHFFTPENSSLPDNLIKSIACSDNKVFVATGGTVTMQKVVTIEADKWKSLPIEGYYLMDMDVDLNGIVYVIDDTGLSSTMMSNKIYQYKNGECQNILPQESLFYPHPYCIKTDLRNYLWVAQFNGEGKPNLVVYDGKKWHTSPDNFQQLYIRCMAADQKNNIWLGTSDGIFILNQ